MKNKKCECCDLCANEHCIKFRDNRKCEPSTRDWLIRSEYDEPMEFIPVELMCRKSSIFGNEYIGLTQSDIDRIMNGEVIHIPGEYGTFIGFITEEV